MFIASAPRLCVSAAVTGVGWTSSNGEAGHPIADLEETFVTGGGCMGEKTAPDDNFSVMMAELRI